MNGQDRLFQRKWGVFTHFLYGVPGGCEEQELPDDDWNERVRRLDTERIARTLHDVGARYYFFTLMQGRKYMAAPNATFDRIAGTKPGEACSERDLILDLAKALEKYDIDLYLYFTGDGPYVDEEIGRNFGFIEPRKNVSMDFVCKWAGVLQEYSMRYGSSVKGWWVDGCYDSFNYNDDLLRPYYTAIKSGNPDAICSFNNGVKPQLQKWFYDEEFTSGEENDFTLIPPSRFINGAQAHILAPLGTPAIANNPYGGWCRPGVKRSADYMCDYIRKVNDAGGVVTIDVDFHRDGTFAPEQLGVLKQIGAAI